MQIELKIFTNKSLLNIFHPLSLSSEFHSLNYDHCFSTSQVILICMGFWRCLFPQTKIHTYLFFKLIQFTSHSMYSKRISIYVTHTKGEKKKSVYRKMEIYRIDKTYEWEATSRKSKLLIPDSWQNPRLYQILTVPNILSSCKFCHLKVSILSASSFKVCCWTSLVAQWLRICLPMQGTQVRTLVWENPTCRGATKSVCHNY